MIDTLQDTYDMVLWNICITSQSCVPFVYAVFIYLCKGVLLFHFACLRYFIVQIKSWTTTSLAEDG